MSRYLSVEWFEETNAALASATGAADADVHLVLQQVVTGTPQGDVPYRLEVSGGTVRLVPGRADAPDAVITEDYDTAVALHRGHVTLQQALLAGRVKIAGNMGQLVAHQEALAGLDPLPADARTGTTY